MDEELIVHLRANATVADARNATRAALVERIEAMRIRRETAIGELVGADRALNNAQQNLRAFDGAPAPWAPGDPLAPATVPAFPAPTTDAPRRRT